MRQTTNTNTELLTREAFRRRVFERDNGRCVFCGERGVDAHHIMERRLYPDGGYYLDNGAMLCEHHHLEAEKTTLSCETLRHRGCISNTNLPPHLYPDACWDKWGNMILPGGQRVPGELFDDPSVQKVLKSGGVLPLFTPWVKYPRTYHLPGSPGVSKDDRVLDGVSHFQGRRVIVTEKRDGENTTLYRNYLHARSLDMDGHPSRDWVKNYASRVGHNIPEGWRVCGENLWAKHSIPYTNLSNYFEGFSIWDGMCCLDWDSTLEWFELLDMSPVPILYDGLWFDGLSVQFTPSDITRQEGFVVRLAERFHYSQFRLAVAKWVRPNHVATTHHWRSKPVIRNTLKGALE